LRELVATNRFGSRLQPTRRLRLLASRLRRELIELPLKLRDAVGLFLLALHELPSLLRALTAGVGQVRHLPADLPALLGEPPGALGDLPGLRLRPLLLAAIESTGGLLEPLER